MQQQRQCHKVVMSPGSQHQAGMLLAFFSRVISTFFVMVQIDAGFYIVQLAKWGFAH